MKTIALFGGSFNPSHEGHFEMGKYIYETLRPDEVWFLFSLNWQKDPAVYASIKHRMAMGEIMAAQYPDLPFVMSDIENDLKTHITHEVLKGLKERFPDHQFIWTMGADNLATFDSWEHSDEIIENFPIAVFDRPSDTERALNGKTAKTYAHLRAGNVKELMAAGRGWCFLDNPRIDVRSSNLLMEIKAGRRQFGGKFQPVADYIFRNGLYGMTAPSSEPIPHPAP